MLDSHALHRTRDPQPHDLVGPVVPATRRKMCQAELRHHFERRAAIPATAKRLAAKPTTGQTPISIALATPAK